MEQPGATLFHVGQEAGSPGENSILSQALVANAAVKVVRFVFSRGQELSEHTAAMPALLMQVSGRALWKLGAQEHAAEPGDWAYMPANLSHSITATEETVLLLLLLKGAAGSS